MFERFAPVYKYIKHPLVVGLKSFSDDSDEFLKNAPDAFGYGKLDDTVRRLMKKFSDGLICGEALYSAQDVVLKHRNRYAGQLASSDSQKPNSAEMGFLQHGFGNQTTLDELYQCQFENPEKAWQELIEEQKARIKEKELNNQNLLFPQ